MTHKFKIKDKIYVPNNPNRKKYDDNNDLIGIVIDYVESCSFLSEAHKQYYLKQGYNYVIVSVEPCEGLRNTADLVKESELRRYYGHDYDVTFYDIIKNFESELKRKNYKKAYQFHF